MKRISMIFISLILMLSMIPMPIFAIETSELDSEIASLVMTDYSSQVSFAHHGSDQTLAENWISGNSTVFEFNNWGGKNNRCGAGECYTVDLRNKNTFDLRTGFIYHTNIMTQANATQFDGDVNYLQIGTLKIVIDFGQNIGGTRGCGVYLYNGGVLIASADKYETAGDAAFKSLYASGTLEVKYLDESIGMTYTVGSTVHTVVWTMADGSGNAEYAPVSCDMSDADISIHRAGTVGKSKNNIYAFTDPYLKTYFPCRDTDDVIDFFGSLDGYTSSDSDVAIARQMYDYINSYGSDDLKAFIAQYEDKLVRAEFVKSGALGEVDGSVRDSGNIPLSFFRIRKWTDADPVAIYEMGDGSIKFDSGKSASFDSYYNSGFRIQVKGIGGWALSFRKTTADTDDGYVIGFNYDKYLYFREGASSDNIAIANQNVSGFYDAEWHELGVYFKDYDDRTEISIYIDGLQVYMTTSADGYSSIDGTLIDYSPKQDGNFFNINTYVADGVSGMNSVSFRSVDCTKKTAIKTIACVGDSITQGACSSNLMTYSYPAYLQRILGTDNYEVVNCGRSAATLMQNTYAPYNLQQAYKRSIASKADYVVIMLGTNDAAAAVWETAWSSYPSSVEKFYADMKSLIQAYIDNGSEVIIMTSPYSHNEKYKYVAEVVEIQKQVAEDMGLDIIDLYTYSKTWGFDYGLYSVDGLHFIDEGYERTAQYVADYFKTRDLKAEEKLTTPDRSDVISLRSGSPVTSYNSSLLRVEDFCNGGFWNSSNSIKTVVSGGRFTEVYSNQRFDLGMSYQISFSMYHATSHSSSYCYDEEGTYLSKSPMYMSVGALSLQIRPMENESGVRSYVYDLFVNGVRVGSKFMDSGTSAPSDPFTYTVKFDNGNITVLRNSETVMEVSSETYFATRHTTDYTYDGVRIILGNRVSGGYIGFGSLSVKKV